MSTFHFIQSLSKDDEKKILKGLLKPHIHPFDDAPENFVHKFPVVSYLPIDFFCGFFKVSMICNVPNLFVLVNHLKSLNRFFFVHELNLESHFYTGLWRFTDKSFMNAEIVFQKSPEDFRRLDQ